tara:strand:- start:10 stop:840 length:831 start_codon:yes stop_codon:yes gene_type:complete
MVKKKSSKQRGRKLLRRRNDKLSKKKSRVKNLLGGAHLEDFFIYTAQVPRTSSNNALGFEEINGIKIPQIGVVVPNGGWVDPISQKKVQNVVVISGKSGSGFKREYIELQEENNERLAIPISKSKGNQIDKLKGEIDSTISRLNSMKEYLDMFDVMSDAKGTLDLIIGPYTVGDWKGLKFEKMEEDKKSNFLNHHSGNIGEDEFLSLEQAAGKARSKGENTYFLKLSNNKYRLITEIETYDYDERDVDQDKETMDVMHRDLNLDDMDTELWKPVKT